MASRTSSSRRRRHPKPFISNVAGRPWTQYLHEKVFKPLDMHATHPTNTIVPLPNRAQGYDDNDRLIPIQEWTAFRPSGSYYSTVLDLAKWDAALYGDEILADSTRREMWAPVTLNDGSSADYGLGWTLQSFDGHRVVYHTGGMPGWRAAFARFVDDGLTVIPLMNLNDVDIGVLWRGVARLYLADTPAQQ